VGLSAGLDNVEKAKSLILLGLELRLLFSPVRSQSLYRLHYVPPHYSTFEKMSAIHTLMLVMVWTKPFYEIFLLKAVSENTCNFYILFELHEEQKKCSENVRKKIKNTLIYLHKPRNKCIRYPCSNTMGAMRKQAVSASVLWGIVQTIPKYFFHKLRSTNLRFW
jgi:hypothetical protein